MYYMTTDEGELRKAAPFSVLGVTIAGQTLVFQRTSVLFE
jgi:hypothetical protein